MHASISCRRTIRRWLWLVLLASGLGEAKIPAAAANAGDVRDPAWIWLGDGPPTAEVGWFRKPFRTPPYTWNARLTVAAAGEAEVYLNGRLVAVCSQPGLPVRAEVSMNLIQGENLLAVRARRLGGSAGLLVHLNLGGTETAQVVSDESWFAAAREDPGWDKLPFDAGKWPAVRTAGTSANGLAPWTELVRRASATPAESLKLLPGFKAELLRSALPEEGSWICLTFDERGRLYVASEGDSRPVLRFGFDAAGRLAGVEPVPAPIRYVMGMVFAHGSLFANAKGPAGNGLYRLTDTNRNDRFDADELRLLGEFKGGGEHGYHAVTAGPDGRIYVMNGNVTRLLSEFSARSPHRNYGEDVLSPNPDEGSRAGGALAPGGSILRTDPDGREWELFAGGFRNAYDFDFDPEGELFSFDSDAEWDWGTPWYRPTRVYHCVSAAEIGWRDGTRPWPDHYPDKIPGVLDVGIGSPCGVKFGTRARFPEAYRRALFLQDWSYGRILAVHLQPHGATYRGTFEEFVKGQPLNLTSMAFGPDGALYFVTGGRGTQSGLYRVTYGGGPVDTGPLAARVESPATRDARALRRRLESFHGREQAGAVDAAWDALGSSDPALRYAARIAVEAQPVPTWLPRAWGETNALRALTALLGLARVAPTEHQGALLKSLTRFPLDSLDEDLRLLKLRVIELSFLRQGRPADELVRLAVAKLSPRYPASSARENRELTRLLTWLEAPGVVPRTLDLLESAPDQEQQIHYVAQLRNMRTGWTPADRTRYFAWWLRPRDHLQRPGSLLHWFHDVGRTYVDGAAVDRHLNSFRRDALAAVPEAERPALQTLVDAPMAGAQLIPAQPRAFVREWKFADLVGDLDRAGVGRSYERGRRAFIDTQCYACHRFGDSGGATGPELTAVAGKYGRREILESLLEPSKVISDQFRNLRVFLKDGEDVTGRLVRESDQELVLETDPLSHTEQTVPRTTIDDIRPSTVSAMPEGLLNALGKEDILDLLAFLESGGRTNAPAFGSP